MTTPQKPLTNDDLREQDLCCYAGAGIEPAMGLRLIADLRATRAELATLRGVVRELKHVCRDAAWMQDEQGGDEAGARLIVDGHAKYIRDRFIATYRKLVAVAQEVTDA